MPDDDESRPTESAAALRDLLDTSRREAAAEARLDARQGTERLGEDSSFFGIAVAYGERGDTVAVSLRDGRLLHGTIEVMGHDVMILRLGAGARVVLPRAGITAIRAPGRPVLAAAPANASVSLHQILSDLLVERSEVRMRLLGADAPFGGELLHVGHDCLVVWTSGEPGTTATIPFDGLAELVLVG